MISQNLGEFFANSITGLKKIKEHSETRIEFYSTYGVFEDYSPAALESFPIYSPYVNFEDNNIIRRCLKLENDTLVSCTEDEHTLVHNWIIEYFNNTSDFPEIYLPCFNPNDNNLYQGVLSITDIKAKGFFFTTVECEYPVAKYDILEDKWIEVVMTMWDDGTYILNPDGYCDRCVKFLSQKEKDKLPPFPVGYENSPFIKFDFVTETWKDSRTLDDLKESYYQTVNSRFNDLLTELSNYYLNTGYNGAAKLFNITLDTSNNENELYKLGVTEVSKVFGFSNDIKITNDFSEEELIKMYSDACALVNGQRDAWLNLPKKLLNSSRYNLSTNDGWDKIIDKFSKWFNSVHD